MMFSVLMSLLLVGSLAANTKDCPAGQEQDGTDDACKACAAGTFTAGTAKEACETKGTAKTKEECDALNRAVGANSDTELTKNDRLCAPACNEGYTTAGATNDAVETEICDKCAIGFGSSAADKDDCVACDPATTFSAEITDFQTVCGPKDDKPCTDTIAEGKAVIVGDGKTDAQCGCAGGKYGVGCGSECAKDTFLVAGLNTGADASACKALSKCESTVEGKKEYGIKTKGDMTKDNECNMSPPAVKSSAAALAFTALTLFAMLF